MPAKNHLSQHKKTVKDRADIPKFLVAINSNATVTVPAGEYILGDPCYTVPDDAWSRLLDSCGCFDDATPVGTVLGYQVLAFGTAHGDGIYEGSDGYEYAVDAGLIGLVPASMPGITNHDDDTTWPPRRVRFLAPTVCWNDRGILHFGHFTIDTN